MADGPGGRFQKGHKLAKGGLRNPPGGRPTVEQVAAKKEAKEIAREYIEKHIQPIMQTYVALAAAQVMEFETPEGKKEYKISVDPTTTRDAVNKWLPAAKQEIGVTANVDVGLNRESLIALMATPEGRAAAIAITKALAGVKP